MSGRLIAAARAIIGMSQAELAAASNLSVSTVKRIEATGAMGLPGVLPNNAQAIVAALETAGVVFLPGNGAGPGVAMQKNNSQKE